MAETSTIAVEVKVDSKNAEKSVGSIKSRLKEARTELTNAIENFGEFSQEAANAAKNVEGLKGTIDDASRLVAAFDGDKKFAAFGGAVSAVASGFSAAQGAIGLFGTQSKEVEEALLKVNSAMALSQGIDGVLEGQKAFKDLGSRIKDTTAFQKAQAVATSLAEKAQKLFTGSVDTTSKGFKGLRGAIIATGIGALVVLAGLVIENFDSIKKVIEKLLGPLKGLTDFVGKLVTGFTDFIGLTSEADRTTEKLKKSTEKNNKALENQIEIMQAQGATSKEIRAVKNKMYEDELNNIRAVLAAQGKLSEEEAARFRDLKQQQAVLAAEQGKEDKDAAAAANAKKIEAANKAAEAAKQAAAERKRLKANKDAEDKKNLEDFAKFQKDLKKAAKPTEEDFKALEEEGERLRKIEEENEKKRLKTIEDNELFRLNQKKKFADLDALNKPDSIENKIAKINADLELELFALEEGDLQRQILAKAAADAIVAIGKEKSKQEIEAEKATADAKKAIQDQSLNVISQGISFLQNIFGQSKAVQKASLIAESAVGIAKIVIGTQSAIAADTAAAALMGPAGIGYLATKKVLNKVSAALGIAANLAATKKGLSALGGGSAPNVGVSLSGGNGSVSAPLAPQAQTTRLDQGQINQIGNASARAFVVESDITGNQEKIRRLNRQARIN